MASWSCSLKMGPTSFFRGIAYLPLPSIHAVRAGYFREGNYPASTLVRVVQFVREGALIEIDADAVIRTETGA